ncbi:sensor histidine kinase [Arthrobacter cavernae]|uniref:histidine kinase n=1 Tax=Arthrobacter cavernae TaxID=2817681 RepID=A0A939KML8_9MICC|nr:histidine kinase [Arthrobacter cavernae]MBO1268351.1 two-component sensor histidine kinase [Arthrobacter cavernae]
MEQTLKLVRQWGAPVAAVVFFALWMGPYYGLYGSFLTDQGRIPAVVAISLAIAVSVRWPAVSLGIVGALLALLSFRILGPMAAVAVQWQIFIGVFVALGFMMWTASTRWRTIAVAANIVFAAVFAYLVLSRSYGMGGGWMWVHALPQKTMVSYWWLCFAVLLLIAAGCASVGIALRLYEERGSLSVARNLAQASLKETEIELVVEQERTRIARDLHDVLAHSLAVIAAQADGTRYLSQDQPKAVLDALENIAVSARHALVDAQRVIEGVRDDGLVAPQPRLTDVGPLIERMRQGSLKVQHSETGKPVDLGGGQQLAVFRIVQECLTNALKHGGRGTAVRLHLDWSGPGLTLHVASALPASASIGGSDDGGSAARVGRGIPGMRERAHLAGGWLTSGPDGEQFRVTVFIPYGSHAASRSAEEAADKEAGLAGAAAAGAALTEAAPTAPALAAAAPPSGHELEGAGRG